MVRKSVSSWLERGVRDKSSNWSKGQEKKMMMMKKMEIRGYKTRCVVKIKHWTNLINALDHIL